MWSKSPWSEPDGNRSDTRAQVETHYLRISRLRRMSYDELRALLAGDPSKAAPWIASAARYGLPEAQVRLGQMLLDGAGVPRDETAALNWFLCAARKGSREAMNMAGRCHENGWGVAEDLEAAACWYRSSADAGHDWGAYNYANMLFDGRGVALDLEQAITWYRRAADQGHTRAMNLLARCYEEGWGAPRDAAAAFEWYQRSAAGGYFRAQFNYASVLATTGRIAEAVGWFERACAAATPESLLSMTDALIRHGDSRLSSIGHRFHGTANR